MLCLFIASLSLQSLSNFSTTKCSVKASQVFIKAWSDENLTGYPLYKLMSKLKTVKKALKIRRISSNYFDSPRKHIE